MRAWFRPLWNSRFHVPHIFRYRNLTNTGHSEIHSFNWRTNSYFDDSRCFQHWTFACCLNRPLNYKKARVHIYIYTHILKESRILIYQRSLLWLRNFFFFSSFLLPFSAHTFAKLSIKEKERGSGTGTALKNRRGERKSGARCRGINQRWEWYKNIEPRGGGLLASLLEKKKKERRERKKSSRGRR